MIYFNKTNAPVRGYNCCSKFVKIKYSLETLKN